MKGVLSRHRKVAFYVPNVIGYIRIACSLSAFAVAFSRPLTCIALYLFSFVCDELDGRAARTFNQTSTLGAVLDMLTDRLSTTGLLILLCLRFQTWYMVFMSLIFLDIFSHWLQMYSSLVAGHISHKQTHNQSWLVRYYYTRRIFMGACCVCCEVLYLMMFIIGLERPWEHSILPWRQTNQRLPLLLAVAAAAFPGMIVKQIVNIAQVRAACNSLILLDLLRDEELREKTR